MDKEDLERVLENTEEISAAAARVEVQFADFSDGEIQAAIARLFKHRTGITEALKDVVARWKVLDAEGKALPTDPEPDG